MLRLCHLLMILLGLGSALVPLQAEVFPLDMGRVGHQVGTLDVARDAGFQNILVSFKLGDKQEYLVNFPETAVYYVRVRQQGTVVWQEAIVALLANSDATRRPRLDWISVPQAVRYRLWLGRYPLRTRWFETQGLAAHLTKVGAPWLIRLRGITAHGELVPVPELRFQWVPATWGRPAPVTPKEPEIFIDLSAPDDDQVVYEPDDKDLLSGPDEGPMSSFVARSMPSNLPPLVRKHEVLVWFRYLREEFSIDKKDRFEAEPSSGLGTGAAGRYYLAPNLLLSGAIDTHATLTDYEAGGTQAPNTEQKRIRLHVALGLDLLNTHIRTTDWSLNLGPVAGLVQMPLQQNEQKFTDYGLHIAGHYHPSRVGLSILFLKSGSREIDSSWIAPWTIWSMQPFLGAYLYNTRHSAGVVTGHFEESGLRFGLERDF
ncbi:hypothetical protein [Oligoflexus tunisiensis]|uniref:hypothetical protein n=1 Tax=Oligoflexus tunisiensis TaxID=708132 RepID=UPI00114D0700|nr:hypothetical protein [Oligoflexus tunisiensis]